MEKLVSRLRNRIQRTLTTLNGQYRRSRVRNALFALIQKPLRIPLNSRYVVFLVPGEDIVNGGIMSICSIATETQKLFAENNVAVVVCTAHKEPRMTGFTLFDNDIELRAFDDLLAQLPSGAEVLVHVPEFFVSAFVADCANVYEARPDINWKFNILLQNIDLMPSRSAVLKIQKLGSTTVTVAHEASADAARRLGFPVYHLSWFICAEDFEPIVYAKKKRLIVTSPDDHSEKSTIVRQMSAALPDHSIIEIRDMNYEKYKTIIGEAKFMFTFGEGLDGYFVEAILSGAIAMAIFEERFFTLEYRGLEGLFNDSNHAQTGVAGFLIAADNEESFSHIAHSQYELVARTFNRKEYRDRVRTFYSECYPEWFSPDFLPATFSNTPTAGR